MHLELWMIITLGLFWVVSMIVYGRTSFETGVTSLLAHLSDHGYIKITDNDEVIGLCNQDQANHKEND